MKKFLSPSVSKREELKPSNLFELNDVSIGIVDESSSPVREFNTHKPDFNALKKLNNNSNSNSDTSLIMTKTSGKGASQLSRYLTSFVDTETLN